VYLSNCLYRAYALMLDYVRIINFLIIVIIIIRATTQYSFNYILIQDDR